VTWRWQEPITAVEHWHSQRTLGAQLRSRNAPAHAGSLRLQAGAFRLASHDGEAMGPILVPRLGLDTVLVEGTSEADLAKGPGFYAGDFLPGEDRLVYIAGHRTTYSAPFSQIDLLRRGDTITVRMPYGTFRYRVTGHRIVSASDIGVLRSTRQERLILQSCHPPLLGDAPLSRLRTSGSNRKRAVEPVGDGDGSSKLELDEGASDLVGTESGLAHELVGARRQELEQRGALALHRFRLDPERGEDVGGARQRRGA
jgi:sortase A